ncbi:MAG: hypothetical protein ACKOBV_02800, partial [Candidatus Kapaibacterium sp.]
GAVLARQAADITTSPGFADAVMRRVRADAPASASKGFVDVLTTVLSRPSLALSVLALLCLVNIFAVFRISRSDDSASATSRSPAAALARYYGLDAQTHTSVVDYDYRKWHAYE